MQTRVKREKHPSIRVYGIGAVMVQPDKASITVGVITEGNSAAAVQAENAAKISAVIAAIIKNGVQRDQIQTSEYKMDILYDFAEGKQVFKGYRVTHLLRVSNLRTELAGTVIDAAAANGANFFSNVTFQVSQSSVHYQRALTLAVQDAQNKASSIAKSVHAKIILEPFEIIELTDNEPQPRVLGLQSAAVAATSIEPGQTQIAARVSALFRYSGSLQP
ncbi:SIMPL domain-containing protein [Peribacillus deserti]|uniref:SIMPL domain-containing protein n=1 Tax=Peribacillus deserti TaxID=673318 RepID=A0A2N5M943_9BACI|nr:SIMPL domain-containing protein [Peribacillus deserti]PLT30874.1 SIMPL domain-containing protein [Peribacillus deserti]